VIYGNEVTVGDMPTELFIGAPSGQANVGGPLSIFLDAGGKVLIGFTGVATLLSKADVAGLRYQILVDCKPILPTVPEVMLSPDGTGATLSVTAMPFLGAGPHTIQVVAQSAAGASHVVKNTALTAVGPLD
jgi:hypothetical protein